MRCLVICCFKFIFILIFPLSNKTCSLLWLKFASKYPNRTKKLKIKSRQLNLNSSYSNSLLDFQKCSSKLFHFTSFMVRLLLFRLIKINGISFQIFAFFLRPSRSKSKVSPLILVKPIWKSPILWFDRKIE